MSESTTPSAMGAADRLLLAERKRRKRLLAAACVALGVALGTGASVVLAGTWLKGYLESPQLWQDLSASAGVELTATGVHARWWPLELTVAELDARREGARVLAVRKLEAELSPLPLLAGVAEVSVRAASIDAPAAVAKAQPGAGSGAGGAQPTGLPAGPRPSPLAMRGARASLWPAAFLRRSRLRLAAGSVRLPVEYAPITELELVAELEPAPREGLRAQVSELRAFGLKGAGSFELDASYRGTFELVLDDRSNLLNGRVTGTAAPRLREAKLKAELRLPGGPVRLAPGTHWLVREKLLAASGSARLSGALKLTLDGARPDNPDAAAWSADAAWDLDLTATAIDYGPYSKPAGRPATSSGKFAGASGEWKLSDLSLVLGGARARLEFESRPDQSVRVAGGVEPFQIAEFVPLLFAEEAKGASKPQQAPMISGMADAKVDLTLASGGEPSGMLTATLDDWRIDGKALMRLGSLGELARQGTEPGLALSGEAQLRGKISANVERGAFRESSIKLVADLSDLGLKAGQSFEKQSGQPLVADLIAESVGNKSLAIKSARLQGPGGLRIALKGTVTDLKDYQARLQLVESRVPMKVLGELVPAISQASGALEVSGELQGSLKSVEGLFAKLGCSLRNVSFTTASGSLRRATGDLELVASESAGGTALTREAGSEEEDAEPLEPGLGWLVRTQGMSGQWALAGSSRPPVAFELQGQAGYKARALRGDLTARLGELDASPWLASSPSTWLGALDLRRSRLRLSVSAPRVTAEKLVAADVQAALLLGAPGSAAELVLERLTAQALEGELSLKGQARLGGKGELTISGAGVSLNALARLATRKGAKAGAAPLPARSELEGRVTLSAPGSGELEGEASSPEGKLKVALRCEGFDCDFKADAAERK